jgi:hypothetical protein
MSVRVPFLAVVAVAAIGCSGPVADDLAEVADASGAMTEGVVVVERRVSGDGVAQTSVSAKFMRLGSPVDPELAERVVGTKLDLPTLGTCRPVTAATVDTKTHGRGSIELIDVGDLSLRAGTQRLPLAVRAFPDVGDLVSGMFYTSRDTASDLPLGATYTLESTGAGAIERFAVDVDGPLALEDVRLGTATLADGVVVDETQPLAVRWRALASLAAPESAGATPDVVIVDVGADSGASVRCAFPDEGSGVLPAWIFRASTLGALPATATIAVRRLRERSFASVGVDTGEVRFDVGVIGRITVGR